MIVSLGGQSIELRPAGTVFVQDALIVADVHLGKERAFRQQGVPVPEGPSAVALVSLSKEIEATGAQRLIFLGDLFHHENAIAGVTFELLACWLKERPSLSTILIKGNHDRIPTSLQSAIETLPSHSIGDLGLYHHPQDTNEPHLAGHLHPAVTLRQGHHSERLRCFWRRQSCLILPSFSDFTGSSQATPEPGDEIYVGVGNEVKQVHLPTP
jgi:DNA ligase-associated metallophosphoesterase